LVIVNGCARSQQNATVASDRLTVIATSGSDVTRVARLPNPRVSHSTNLVDIKPDSSDTCSGVCVGMPVQADGEFRFVRTGNEFSVSGTVTDFAHPDRRLYAYIEFADGVTQDAIEGHWVSTVNGRFRATVPGPAAAGREVWVCVAGADDDHGNEAVFVACDDASAEGGGGDNHSG
jgi:hypothetical protein